MVTAVTAGDSRVAIDVPRGHCVRINTGWDLNRNTFYMYCKGFKIPCIFINPQKGAPVPQGCDAVIQVEDTKVVRKSADGEELEIALKTAVQPGNDIRPVGSDIELGQFYLVLHRQIGRNTISVLGTGLC